MALDDLSAFVIELILTWKRFARGRGDASRVFLKEGRRKSSHGELRKRDVQHFREHV